MSIKLIKQFKESLFTFIKETGIISIKRVKNIANRYNIENYNDIVKEWIKENHINIKKIIVCPECFNDLGNTSNFNMGKNYQCEYCGNNFTVSKENRDLFFSKSYSKVHF